VVGRHHLLLDVGRMVVRRVHHRRLRPADRWLADRDAHAPPDLSVVYECVLWGYPIDVDGDCQDTRAEVLQRDASPGTVTLPKTRCTVVGGSWLDPYSGATLTTPGPTTRPTYVRDSHPYHGSVSWQHRLSRFRPRHHTTADIGDCRTLLPDELVIVGGGPWSQPVSGTPVGLWQ